MGWLEEIDKVHSGSLGGTRDLRIFIPQQRRAVRSWCSGYCCYYCALTSDRHLFVRGGLWTDADDGAGHSLYYANGTGYI